MYANIDTMLDPSLFADNSYESTFEMIEERNFECNFSIPQSFSKLLRQDELITEEPVREFFSSYSSFYEYEKMTRRFEEAEISTFSAGDYLEEYEPYYRTIAEDVDSTDRYVRTYGEGSVLVDILFEEFVFSVENSPILSRLKKVAEKFKNTVAYTVEISEQMLDQNWENMKDRIGGRVDNFRQIKQKLRENAEERLDGEHPVIVSTYLRQAVKDYSPNWIIDFSGNELASAIGGAVGGSIGGATTGPVGGGVGGAVGGLGTASLQRFVMFMADP